MRRQLGTNNGAILSYIPFPRLQILINCNHHWLTESWFVFLSRRLHQERLFPGTEVKK